MGALHLYYNPYSDCSQRVMLMLAEKGLEPTRHVVDLLRSEQLTDAFHAVTPKCEVPAIVEEGRAMHESCDILRHLERTHPTPSLTARNTGLMEQRLDEAAVFHDTGVVEFVYATGLGRRPTPRDFEFYRAHVPHRFAFHQARLRGERGCDRGVAEDNIRRAYAPLEHALADHPWLCGSTYSLADIAWFPSVFMLEMFGFSLAPFPNLAAWSTRVQSRPAFQTGIRAHLRRVPPFVLRWAARMNNRFGGRR